MTQFLLNTLTGLIISVVTVQLALFRFHREKWWERRFQVYQTIINALYDMKKYIDECLSQLYDERHRAQFGSDGEDDDSVRLDDDLVRKRSEAELEIIRVTAIGDFIVSKEAVQYLEQLRADLLGAKQQYPDDDEMLERQSKSLDRCLERIRECAMKQLNSPWP